MQVKKYTLGKKERLKSRKAIDGLFNGGHRFTVSPVRVFYQLTQGTELKFGVAVSTKLYKKAVDRNRVKRVIRECWRLQKNQLQERLKEKNTGLDVFFVYTDRELPVFDTLFRCTGTILQKLNERLNG